MISIKSLRVDYEDVNAVKDIDLEIPSGQIYGLVGPNGAGKTSTIKSIAGIIEPTYGEIKVAGYDLELETLKALQVLGYMPDFPPVYENLKVWEYLDVFAAAYKIREPDRGNRVKHWLSKVSLTDKRDTFIKDLSRGMRQRLILAKTLLPNPKVLILDEPASGLDPIARMEMRDILKEASAAGITILISSHILTELSEFCDAVGIMEKGVLRVTGSIDDIRVRLGSEKRLLIRLASNTTENLDKVSRFLASSKHCDNVLTTNQKTIECSFAGSADDAAWILSQLTLQETAVCDFRCEEDDVEDIFLKIGAKEVS